MRWLWSWPASLALLGLAVAATYLHTLDVPFYLDDYSSILENDLIYDWQGLGPLRQYAPLRLVCYCSGSGPRNHLPALVASSALEH